MKAGTFDNLPPLSKSDALRILKTPIKELALSSDYYKAVFHLAKFDCSECEIALIDLVKSDSKETSVLLAKRKAIEVLGRMKSKKAVPHIGKNLKSSDPYIVENCAWALQEIGCTNLELHNTIGSLLDNPNHNRRVLIQSLAKMSALTELPKIERLYSRENLSPAVKGAAIAAIKILKGKVIDHHLLREHLDVDNQNDRQSAVQDIIDSGSCKLLPDVINTPISPFFRLRALDLLWTDIPNQSLEFNILEAIDFVILDNPIRIRLNTNKETLLEPKYLLNDLFNTDFKKCYSSLNLLLKMPTNQILLPLKKIWHVLKKDYGAIYFCLILFRYIDLSSENLQELGMELVELCLDKSWPPYMKFKPQAIFLSYKLNLGFFKRHMNDWLDEVHTPNWVCRYAALICIEESIEHNKLDLDIEAYLRENIDSNKFVRLKLKNILTKFVDI